MHNTFIDKYISIVLLLFLLAIYFLWISYKKDNSKKKYIYGSLLIFIIPITLVSLLKNIVLYIPGTMIGSIDGWLSFLGGYTGALLALGGIWWQIKENNLKEMSKKLTDQNEALYSFLILIQSFSENISNVSEMYLKNYLIDKSITTFDEQIFLYDKNLFFQIVGKLDLQFYKFAVSLSTLFSSLLLMKIIVTDSTGQKQNVYLETFFCEQLEIFKNIEFQISSFLKDPGDLTSESLVLFKAIETHTCYIESKYSNYFTPTSDNHIKEIFNKYNIN